MNTKQVIVMRKDLNMSKGKMVVAGAHASMWAFINMFDKYGEDGEGGLITTYSFNVARDQKITVLEHWLLGHYKKVCVSVKSEQELKDVYQKALDANLPCRLQHDIGLTHFDGVTTLTCCAIGPAEESVIDAITGNLPLL